MSRARRNHPSLASFFPQAGFMSVEARCDIKIAWSAVPWRKFQPVPWMLFEVNGGDWWCPVEDSAGWWSLGWCLQTTEHTARRQHAPARYNAPDSPPLTGATAAAPRPWRVAWNRYRLPPQPSPSPFLSAAVHSPHHTSSAAAATTVPASLSHRRNAPPLPPPPR